jgi:hypothetical protein
MQKSAIITVIKSYGRGALYRRSTPSVGMLIDRLNTRTTTTNPSIIHVGTPMHDDNYRTDFKTTTRPIHSSNLEIFHPLWDRFRSQEPLSKNPTLNKCQ